ncbi:DEAD/DEAH box helicase [Pleurocapsa sp. PCC 7319]|uniref:DEAD/DEAH box helicase n=1 Tax=Pleurocapsa sp. PCC 7319 TaxID=118161 RepID=UPI000345979D|nr:DEAD/DEAH box helicase [Pleurocapsa sp. PCC 7319]
MKILHGTWIPDETEELIQSGGFYLWVEATEPKTTKNSKTIHPYQLSGKNLESFLAQDLGIKNLQSDGITPKYFLLPTVKEQPLPSLELARYLETELPEEFTWQYWEIDCYQTTTSVKVSGYSYELVNNVIKLLNELHFIAINSKNEIQFGADLLFWYYYTQSFKQIILQDQYIPALKYYQPQPKTKRRKKRSDLEIYPGWEIISPTYEDQLANYLESMPKISVAGFAALPKTPHFYDEETLLRHFSECLLTDIVTHTPTTAKFSKQLSGTILEKCTDSDLISRPGTNDLAVEEYQQWQSWRYKITHTQDNIPFYLYFQLQTPKGAEEPWQLQFQVAPKKDPSLKISLQDYWRLGTKKRTVFYKQFGSEFESNLLLNLGYAARIYPLLWTGLETNEPKGVILDLDEAFEFLKETAWILENAGYKVIVPAWWTPKGRKRAKLRLKVSGSSQSATKSETKSYFGLDTLVQYQYQLSIGNHPVTQEEWEQLVNAKVPLVKFRGEWVELDLAKMQQMLEFWQQQGQENQQMSLLELLQREAEAGAELEFERDDTLEEMLQKLNDKSQLELVTDLPNFQGKLRKYQQRGVSWLNYLENLGLNGCLADDMGLGKTIEVIARLIQERNDRTQVAPTLLIVPTSVIGNWQKEITKFAPHFRSLIHHGSDRSKDASEFQKAIASHDVIITSYTLVRKDAKLFDRIDWQRIVLDEAQNIKNPKAAQTKAILKLNAPHRLALTGTPVENRLLDLWSIFNFLNPGYLGKQAQFRKAFEIPIQKNSDRTKALTLKKLVEPFILRRVKTDKSIIKDLPDKVEQKVYCNLTPEQASLYEAVVQDVAQQIEEKSGIERKGLILSTLMKLKQICNHPRQFLQDESEFTPNRSHKLSRLQEMIEEIQAEQESLLLFTQFREIGDALQQYFRHHYHYPTYYIHGGTNRKQRDKMIAEFQEPDTPPAVFILSLKAGGVGITLTKANHVFHFDRWWNPAVEDQASDRAFRLGQKKNVFVHKFVTLGSLEEKIDVMIEDKKRLSESVVGADESWLTELDNDKFRELIALNRSAVLD